MELLVDFFQNTGFGMADYRHLVMIGVGLIFIYLGIAKHYEPLLLVPIGFGILVGNVPVFKGLGLGIYEKGAVLNYLYFGVSKGIYPPLIFLGIGAMTDFSTLLARPKLILLGAAAQLGVFMTFLGALFLDFVPKEAASIGIIGGADPGGTHCHRSLFIHGLGAGNPATDYETAHQPRRTSHQNE
jgi:oxaloacetate decarboxylase beta subunit